MKSLQTLVSRSYHSLFRKHGSIHGSPRTDTNFQYWTTLKSQIFVSNLLSLSSNVRNNRLNYFKCFHSNSGLRKVFSAPAAAFHQIYAIVASHLDTSHCIEYQPKPGENGTVYWECIINVSWPEEKSESAFGKTKKEACKNASLKILQWLQNESKITREGFPILLDETNPFDDCRIELPEEDVAVLSDLIDHYHNDNIESVITERLSSEFSAINKYENKCILSPVLFAPLSEILAHPELAFSKRSNFLLSRSLKKLASHRKTKKLKSLPIDEFRDDLVSLINDNQVVIIAGETGCGKSTQVPSFIFDEWATRMKGSECNIVITQPRKISAISLAERIALEYSEPLGKVVGYKVRLDQNLPTAPGAILFVTTGILLLQFRSNPGLLGCSHVIVDEAHERDIDIDLLLLLLKRALTLNPNLKVIIMSATLNSDLFSKYFNNAPVMNIPGFMHPVKSIFLSETVDQMKNNQNENKEVSFIPSPAEIASLIMHIHKSKPAGCILCFLPGWSDIQALQSSLSDQDDLNDLDVLPLHSKISSAEQSKVFEATPPDRRKVILSTNIAESSVTINDVAFIIDSGLHKETRWVAATNAVSLDVQWISQANVTQRKGRAGRTRPGECYHLYTESKFKSFPQFPTPGIKKMPLEKVVLDCKVLDEGPVKNFLSQLLEPPSEEALIKAVEELISLNALDEEENLTPLGERMSFFAMHPRLSKALIYSALFKCLTPILHTAVQLSSEKKMFLLSKTRSEHQATKKIYSSNSDHIALHKIFSTYENLVLSHGDYKSFCEQNGLNQTGLNHHRSVKRLYYEALSESSLLCQSRHDSNIDSFSLDNEFVKGVFLSGVGNIMRHQNFVKDGFRKVNVFTSDNYLVRIMGDSVNEDYDGIPSPFLTYFQFTFSSDEKFLIVRESSVISKTTVILFSPSKFVHNLAREDESEMNLNVAGMNFQCSSRDGNLLIHLRKVIADVLQYLILEEGRVTNDDHYQKVVAFRDKLCLLVANLLTKEEKKMYSILSESNSKE